MYPTGNIPVICRKLILKIGLEEFPTKVGWALEEGIISILGREDVFDLFHIEFLQDQEMVRFTKV